MARFAGVRCVVLSLLVAVCVAVAFAGSAAAAYPTKPITVFNSSTAGSPTDVMARQVAQHARKSLGQPMVVVNKPGGGGGVMFAALFAEPADGYAIASLTASQVTGLHAELKKDFSFDDLDFLASVQRETHCLVVRADSPFKTAKDVVEHARKNPGVKIGGQGTGSALHLMVMLLAEQSGTKLDWVPLGGGSESVTNLLGGTVPVISTSPATVNQYVEAKQMRVIAVTDEKRVEHLPDVPTFREQGFDIVMSQYRGFAARKGMPAEAKAKLADAIYRATREPAFKEFMAKNHQPDGYLGPEEFTKLARQDFEMMGRLMQKLGTTKK
jgi:putative tricarboxylic transport membrane protein